MTQPKVYAQPNLITPNRPVIIDPEVCTGCNLCVEICPSDVYIPNPQKGKPPIILYPEECWYCGCCLMECPLHDKGANKLNWPLMQRMRWKRKETGEHFRFGMPNPPPPNKRPMV
ncbi:MAG: ferredoxin family protein [Deltaproteobacteria bacterium]|nr:ferredoxin family protein [Deltaproteobacteria bacterium]MBW2017408.1 ferredoxin family protein [Deltaproteobacteria bacterium]MBW2130199.1 ferredoxin family protein [Deltaproteobacteria bacterium]MBW2304610.1 ferredoxin family protein [Deltaproteobacteria bacterium]